MRSNYNGNTSGVSSWGPKLTAQQAVGWTLFAFLVIAGLGCSTPREKPQTYRSLNELGEACVKFINERDVVAYMDCYLFLMATTDQADVTVIDDVEMKKLELARSLSESKMTPEYFSTIKKGVRLEHLRFTELKFQGEFVVGKQHIRESPSRIFVSDFKAVLTNETGWKFVVTP